MEARQAAQTRQQVAALYQAHALGLVKLAVLMVGDQRAAEDVVQDAFLGLYRRWSALQDREKALSYVRASVLKGCRTIHRGKYRRSHIRLEDPGHAESAEAIAMLGEAHREVLAALRRLPDRQREAVVLRYYLDMTEDQAAQASVIDAIRRLACCVIGSSGFCARFSAGPGPARHRAAGIPRLAAVRRHGDR
jgi:RNA polymerase sigma factor (sigma-70 family)